MTGYMDNPTGRFEDEACGSCRFFVSDETLQTANEAQGIREFHVGRCLRCPPQITANLAYGKFPAVRSYDWCGEWRGKPDDS